MSYAKIQQKFHLPNVMHVNNIFRFSYGHVELYFLKLQLQSLSNLTCLELPELSSNKILNLYVSFVRILHL